MQDTSILETFNFTKKRLDQLPTPAKGNRKEYRDTTVEGLKLMVYSSGTKTFFVRKRIDGEANQSRIKLGCYCKSNSPITIDQARNAAKLVFADFVRGINPNHKADKEIDDDITLDCVYKDYLQARGSNLKQSTINSYTEVIESKLGDWRDIQLKSITRETVKKRFAEITTYAPTRANYTLRLLKSLFKFAMENYMNSKDEPVILFNPVQVLSANKSWNKEKIRKTVIKTYNMGDWFKAIHALPNHELNKKQPNSSEVVKDYLIFVLFTGLRRREASNLKWTDVDFRDKTLTISETKNNSQHTLPLSDYLFSLLSKRLSQSESVFVFAGSSTTPLNDPKTQVEKVRKICGFHFTLHDLRRTFETTAESIGVPYLAQKTLINHKFQKSDVTAGYAIVTVERLREPMQQITNKLLELCQHEQI